MTDTDSDDGLTKAQTIIKICPPELPASTMTANFFSVGDGAALAPTMTDDTKNKSATNLRLDGRELQFHMVLGVKVIAVDAGLFVMKMPVIDEFLNPENVSVFLRERERERERDTFGGPGSLL